MNKETLTKELNDTDSKIKEREREIEVQKSYLWQLKALLKSQQKHKEALEKAINDLK